MLGAALAAGDKEGGPQEFVLNSTFKSLPFKSDHVFSFGVLPPSLDPLLKLLHSGPAQHYVLGIFYAIINPVHFTSARLKD